MLGKLIRHEFKATWMPMTLMFAGLLAASGLARLFILLLDIFVEDETVATVFSMLITMMHMILFAASLIVVFVFIATRFYNHLYSSQGYLTLMIPAPRWQLLFSKTIVSVTWYLLGTVAAVVSIVVLLSYTEMGYIYAEAFSMVGTSFEVSLGLDGSFMLIVSILSGIVSFFEGVLMLYCSISIGQLFKKHRVVGAVLGYFCINTVINTVTSVITVISTISQAAVLEAFEGQAERLKEITALSTNITSAVMLLFTVLFTVIMYMITNYILKRAVNLQ